MEVLSAIVAALGIVFGLIYAYQIFFMIIGTFCKKKKYPEAKENHSFAVIISARNEEKVIGNLIKSIKENDYPQDKLKIFVCADNCTDDTAKICRELGCIVYERFNQEQIGKGYALNYLFKNITKDFPEYEPDAFFVFDADNVLSKNYIQEMNKALDSGVKICTSYRNSKNYGTNWYSAGASLGFLRECRFSHRPKSALGLSACVSGTGFYVSKEVMSFKDGWNHVSIAEDTEFAIASTLRKIKIGYCEDAEFFDEQPTKFKQTWKQRMRWAKGSFTCFTMFHGSLAASFLKTFNFNYYDYYFTRIFPGTVFYGFNFIASNIVFILARILEYLNGSIVASLIYFLAPLLTALISTYLGMFIDGCIATILNWKKIKAPAKKKIIYMFTYPIFIVFFSIPTGIIALFKKVKWEPIEHTESVSQEQLENIK